MLNKSSCDTLLVIVAWSLRPSLPNIPSPEVTDVINILLWVGLGDGQVGSEVNVADLAPDRAKRLHRSRALLVWPCSQIERPEAAIAVGPEETAELR
jgi:hypothetical protein